MPYISVPIKKKNNLVFYDICFIITKVPTPLKYFHTLKNSSSSHTEKNTRHKKNEIPDR